MTGSIVYALFLSILVTVCAARNRFFTIDSSKKPFRLSFYYLIGAFATYFLASILLVPLLYILLLKIFFPSVPFRQFAHALPTQTAGWFQTFALLLVFLSLVSYLLIIKRDVVKEVFFGGGKASVWKNVGWGVMTLVVAYPVVLLVNLLVSYGMESLFGKVVVQQTAVEVMKGLTRYPILFGFLGVAICTVVPFMEETLFRGFLQTTVRRFLGRKAAIGLTSVCFSLAHFSKSQGMGNIELLIALFVLSCYLGFLYEKRKNLIAPMALHGIFNLITILALFFGA